MTFHTADLARFFIWSGPLFDAHAGVMNRHGLSLYEAPHAHGGQLVGPVIVSARHDRDACGVCQGMHGYWDIDEESAEALRKLLHERGVIGLDRIPELYEPMDAVSFKKRMNGILGGFDTLSPSRIRDMDAVGATMYGLDGQTFAARLEELRAMRRRVHAEAEAKRRFTPITPKLPDFGLTAEEFALRIESISRGGNMAVFVEDVAPPIPAPPVDFFAGSYRTPPAHVRRDEIPPPAVVTPKPPRVQLWVAVACWIGAAVVSILWWLR